LGNHHSTGLATTGGYGGGRDRRFSLGEATVSRPNNGQIDPVAVAVWSAALLYCAAVWYGVIWVLVHAIKDWISY